MFYTIQGNDILIANNKEALSKYYSDVLPLPIDYEAGKYIVQDGILIDNTEAWTIEQAQAKQKELAEYNYQQKAKKAYGGILINNTYLFETNEASQSMITASLIGLKDAPDETTLNWKVYKDNQPLVIPLTKVQLAQLFAFALNMINTSFGIEGLRNEALAVATVEELNNEEWVSEYKNVTDLMFNEINNKIDVVLISENVKEEIDKTISGETSAEL